MRPSHSAKKKGEYEKELSVEEEKQGVEARLFFVCSLVPFFLFSRFASLCLLPSYPLLYYQTF